MGDKTDRLTGKVKETAGKATGDRKLAREGRNEQEKGHFKKAAENIKEGVKKST